MKNRLYIRIFIQVTIVMLLPLITIHSEAQTITNIKSLRKEKQIEITYDLQSPSEVFISLDIDNKTDTVLRSSSSLAKGDIGAGIFGGHKKILLEVSPDVENIFSEKVVFTVKADTGLTNMVYVTGGNFSMGTDNGKEGEMPAHPVKVNNLYVCKYEVTAEEYSVFCNETGKPMPVDPFSYYTSQKFLPISIDGNKKNMAIINVPWDNAVAYCAWLSKKTGKNYRLPTEAEWEFAAKGENLSKGYTYAGGNKKDDVAWCMGFVGSGSSEAMYGSLHQVGRLKPNELGLYDMSGNAWEWCSDFYLSEYYSFSLSDNPKGPEWGTSRILRGGAYDEIDIRVVVRYFGFDTQFTSFGFRVVCSE